MKILLTLALVLGFFWPALGGEITTMVIGEYDSSKASASGATNRMKTIAVVKDEPLFASLPSKIQQYERKKILWYMWDAVPIAFLDAEGAVVAGLEYWPVTKPDGGFRRIDIQKKGKDLVVVEPKNSVGDEEQWKGYLLPQLSDLISAKLPKGYLGPERKTKKSD